MTYAFTVNSNMSFTANFETIEYTPTGSDVMARTGLPITMTTQIVNTCVTASMEYINNNVFYGSVNQGVYLQWYLLTYKVWVIDDGVALEHIEDFINAFFWTSSFSGIQAAIDAGAVVMTDMPSSVDGSGHNIFIIGYQPNGKLIYMDPELGYLKTASEVFFLEDYLIYITGTK